MRNCDGICEFYREMYIGLDPEKQRADELHMENMAKGRPGAGVDRSPANLGELARGIGRRW